MDDLRVLKNTVVALGKALSKRGKRRRG